MSLTLNLTRRSALIQAVLALLFVVLGIWLCDSIRFGIGCAILFWAVSLIALRVDHKYLAVFFTLAIAGASALVNFLLVQLNLNVFDQLASIGAKGNMTYILSILCYFTVIAVIYALTLNVKYAVLFTFAATFVLSTINYFVIEFRGNEIAPSDLFAARTALNVAGNYQFTFPASMIQSWILAVLWNLFVFRSVKLPRPSAKLVFRAVSFLLSIACILFIAGKPQYISHSQWHSQGSAQNGFLLNFVHQFQRFEKPDGYRDFDFPSMEKTYVQTEQPEKKPNVLVIMNEVFADLRCYGGELNTNIPVMPFFDSLTDNTIRGYALASIFGGGTSNSEYEFLTGNSLGFLPSGANGYQQYIEDGSYTINTYMRSLGYYTVAMHPHFPNGWTRSTVWPQMKFDEIHFRDRDGFFEKDNNIRGWISDMEMYDKVLKALKAKPDGKPLFLFGVTVQNHGGYDDPAYTNTVKLSGYSESYPLAEQYLSLVRESDEALQYLLTKLEELDEEVIVLFYGDHQAKIEGSFYEDLNGGSLEDLTSRQKQRMVPFVIWANYDIPEYSVELTSLNYLSNYLLEAAGFPLPPYNQFLKDVEARIPAMNNLGFYSPSAGGFLPYDEAEASEKEILDTYRILQYNAIKGGKNRSQVFFP